METKAVSSVMLTLLLTSLFSLAFNVQSIDSESSEPFATEFFIDWWPMFHHDVSHSGFSTSRAPDTISTIWTYTTGYAVLSSPAVMDGIVFVGSMDTKVYALNASTGELIWNYKTGSYVISSPAVANGRVFVGSYDHKVYALNASSGSLIWNYTTGAKISSSPSVADEKVFVGSWDGKIYALDEATGLLIWSYKTDEYITQSSPAVADEKVFIGSVKHGWEESVGKVYALNASNGVLIWNYITIGPSAGFRSSPTVADGKVFIGSEDFHIYALNETTGEQIWNYETGLHVSNSPAVVHGRVFVGSNDGNLYALNASTGTLIWSFPTNWSELSSPAVADGKVFVGSNNNNVYALAEATGALVWSYTTGHQISSSPAVALGKVFIGSGDHKIYAFSGPVHVTATVDIDPDTLNLRSKGQWISACIELPESYNPEDIDATTILLNETIQPVLDPMYEFVTNSSEYLVDYNEDGILERMVKFDRAEVMALLTVGEATLTITGEVDGIPFEGSDTIRVILPPVDCGGCRHSRR